jgi:hypothetical protein
MSSIRLLKATAYALKYRFTSDGTDLAVSQALLVADAATYGPTVYSVGPSYIQKLLADAVTDVAWAELTDRKDFSIYLTLRTVTAGVVLKAIVPGSRVLVISPCGMPGEVDVELRFIHSIVQ